jgi:hypothetical protein
MGDTSAPRARLHRALERRNLLLAETAARECERLDSAEALGLSLLMVHRGDPRAEVALTRWCGQLLAAHPQLGLLTAAEIIESLQALGGPADKVARSRLALALSRAGENRAAELVARGL